MPDILGLCEIQDPRNLGAIMRTAAATGTGLLLSNDSCDVFSDKVIRTSAGLFDRVGFVQATSREDFLNRLKDRRVFAAALNEGMIYTNLNGMKICFGQASPITPGRPVFCSLIAAMISSTENHHLLWLSSHTALTSRSLKKRINFLCSSLYSAIMKIVTHLGR